ncbi:PREDICTED: uncharacterized protein LOC103917196 [Pygoscelis adeliae]|uniref:uncharacterized protein LOC103917196 n=1 Tax=Pygoscelis adeliae TaxID=9238 RepID=UPI0004F50413|nr:PREDICTED: uncharacterized protein LOC103917196 [Pygoscelis adeliae]
MGTFASSCQNLLPPPPKPFATTAKTFRHHRRQVPTLSNAELFEWKMMQRNSSFDIFPERGLLEAGINPLPAAAAGLQGSSRWGSSGFLFIFSFLETSKRFCRSRVGRRWGNNLGHRTRSPACPGVVLMSCQAESAIHQPWSIIRHHPTGRGAGGGGEGPSQPSPRRRDPGFAPRFPCGTKALSPAVLPAPSPTRKADIPARRVCGFSPEAFTATQGKAFSNSFPTRITIKPRAFQPISR